LSRYRITGTKIYISCGEHDMAENIVHIVLARVEGAPKGVKVGDAITFAYIPFLF